MRTVIAIFCFIVIFSSCDTSRYAYSPTAHNVPILTKQFDSKIAASYSTNGATSSSDNNNNQYERTVAQGFDLQGALAVTNHIGLQTSYYYRNENTNSAYSDINGYDDAKVKYNRNLFELGVGYFTALDTKDRVLFQVFTGAGFGKTKIRENGTDFNLNPYSRYYNTNITKFYIEPAVTFRMKEIFAASIATRASVIKFNNVSTDYTLSEKQTYNLDSLNRYAVAFFEPAFVGSFGFNKLPGFRIEFQVGLSVLWQDSFIDYRPFNFSVGLAFDIGKLIKGPDNDPKSNKR